MERLRLSVWLALVFLLFSSLANSHQHSANKTQYGSGEEESGEDGSGEDDRDKDGSGDGGDTVSCTCNVESKGSYLDPFHLPCPECACPDGSMHCRRRCEGMLKTGINLGFGNKWCCQNNGTASLKVTARAIVKLKTCNHWHYLITTNLTCPENLYCEPITAGARSLSTYTKTLTLTAVLTVISFIMSSH